MTAPRVDCLGGELGTGAEVGGVFRYDEDGGGVEQDGVAAGTAFAGENRAQHGGVFPSVAAGGEGVEGRGGGARRLRGRGWLP